MLVYDNKIKLIITFFLMGVMFQCQEVSNELGTGTEESKLQLIREAQAYSNALYLMDAGEGSDHFVIRSVKIDDSNLIMLVEVSYAGGCEEHQFSLIWPEAITMVYPPNFSVILMHDANGDMCEAWLTETLVIDLRDDSLWLSDQEIRDMTVTVINGSNPLEQVQSR